MKLAKLHCLNSKEISPNKDTNSITRKDIKVQETTDLMAMLQACNENIQKIEYSGKKNQPSPEKVEEEEEKDGDEVHQITEEEKVYQVDLSRTCSPRALAEMEKKEEDEVIPVEHEEFKPVEEAPKVPQMQFPVNKSLENPLQSSPDALKENPLSQRSQENIL
jgi:hypothetical protein